MNAQRRHQHLRRLMQHQRSAPRAPALHLMQRGRLRAPSLLVALLVVACCSTPWPCSAWGFGARGSSAPLPTTATRVLQPSTPQPFETALFKTFREVSLQKTIEQYDRMLSWLSRLPATLGAHVAELQSGDVRAVVDAAGTLVRAVAPPRPPRPGGGAVAASRAAAAAAQQQQRAAQQALQIICAHLDQLSPQQAGFPLTRRVVVGALLKLRAPGPLEPTVQALAEHALLRLFALHQGSAAHKGVIQFFHISKSGGTNMCMAAESNGCATEGFDERLNCLVRDFGDQPRWGTYSAHKFVAQSMQMVTNTPWFINFGAMRRVEMSCAERAAYLREKNWTFYANEFTVPNGELGICSEFVNLMIFRDPVDRLSSQISWIQKLYKSLYNASDISRAFKDRTSSFWERLVPAAVNNYYTRSLLGPRFFQSPVLAVNVTHVQQAMLKVLQHDLLMMLERKAFNDVVLQVGLGWASSIKDDRIRSSQDIKSEIVMPVDYDRLIARNRPDVEVQRFAENLQVLDVLLFNFAALAEPGLHLQPTADTAARKCGYVHSAPPVT